MSDQFTEVTTEGWGQRLGGSLIAALIGFILVIVSIGLLYWNEGRAVTASRALGRGAAAIVEVGRLASGRVGQRQAGACLGDDAARHAGARPGVRRHRRRAAAAVPRGRDVSVEGGNPLAVAAVGRRLEDHRDHLHLPACLVGAADRFGAVQGARRPSEPADGGAVGDIRRRRHQTRRLSDRSRIAQQAGDVHAVAGAVGAAGGLSGRRGTGSIAARIRTSRRSATCG